MGPCNDSDNLRRVRSVPVMAFLGDIITVQSRLKVDEIIKAKANELRRRMGLTVTEENEIATAMFVAVMQAEVVKESEEGDEEYIPRGDEEEIIEISRLEREDRDAT